MSAANICINSNALKVAKAMIRTPEKEMPDSVWLWKTPYGHVALSGEQKDDVHGNYDPSHTRYTRARPALDVEKLKFALVGLMNSIKIHEAFVKYTDDEGGDAAKFMMNAWLEKGKEVIAASGYLNTPHPVTDRTDEFKAVCEDLNRAHDHIKLYVEEQEKQHDHPNTKGRARCAV